MRRTGFALALLVVAGCGDSAPRATTTPTPAGVRSLPDGGMAGGHGGGADAALFEREADRMRVPELDRTPPLAVMRLDLGEGEPIVRRSPEGPRPAAPVALPRPSFTATALVRDMDGGTGRIRVSAVYVTRCDGRDQEHGAYFPPAQIVRHPVSRRARSPLPSARAPRRCASPRTAASPAASTRRRRTPTASRAISDPIRFTWK